MEGYWSPINSGNYIGVEPNKWLVDEGIANEIDSDLVKIKKPIFSYEDSLIAFNEPLELDVATAQSIFSHTGTDLLKEWLLQISLHLKDDGALLATFLKAEKDFDGEGWVYPNCVRFKPDTVSKSATECGLNFKVLNRSHPGQT